MKWLIGIAVLFSAVVIGLSVYLQPNDFLGCTPKPIADTECDVADAIVVVSGGDTQARTTEGIKLYQQGWAPYLILSGAAQDKSGPSNAAAMKLQAEESGIPASAILIDEQAENTQENAENTQSIFKAHDFHDIILVTSGYHQRRASLEFNKRADDATIRNHPVAADRDWGWFWWATPRGWWLAGSEVVRIIGFYAGATS